MKPSVIQLQPQSKDADRLGGALLYETLRERVRLFLAIADRGAKDGKLAIFWFAIDLLNDLRGQHQIDLMRRWLLK